MDRWRPLHFFPGYYEIGQFGLECRVELVKPGHDLCCGGPIYWIDIDLGFFRLRQQIGIAQRFHERLLQKLETILRNAGRIFVQAGAFAVPENAQRVRARIAALGSVQIVPSSGNHGGLYLVRVGPVASDAAAAQLLSRVVDSGYPGARVVTE